MLNEFELQEPAPCVIKGTILDIGKWEGLTDTERRHVDSMEPKTKEEFLASPNVRVLRLCFMNIRKIDNLGCYTGLRELYLANNCITKIENLNHLKELRKLDLSFNEIVVTAEENQAFNPFDGLKDLVRLEELSLFKNKIRSIKDFPALPNLIYLSLGRNKIDEPDEIKNLYKIKTLRILTFVGNPAMLTSNKKDACKSIALAYCKELRFFDYERVNPNEVKDARERHQDHMNQLYQSEEMENTTKQNDQTQKALDQALQEAFLTKINNLKKSLFDKDPDNDKILAIPDISSHKIQFTDDLEKSIGGFIAEIKQLYSALNTQEQLFNEAYSVITEKTRLKMVQVVKKLARDRRNHEINCFREDDDINDEQADDERIFDKETKEFEEKINEAKGCLLEEEFTLVDFVAEMIKYYKNELEKIKNSIAEKINEFFGRVSVINKTYLEKVNEVCNKQLDLFNKGDTVDEKIRGILVDRDTLTSMIQASNTFRSEKIYKRQNSILDDYSKKIAQMEYYARQRDIERNRKRISEITKYIDNTSDSVKIGENDGFDE